MSKNTIEVKRKCCLSTPACKKCPIVVLREAMREAKAEEAAKARKKAAKAAAKAEKPEKTGKANKAEKTGKAEKDGESAETGTPGEVLPDELTCTTCATDADWQPALRPAEPRIAPTPTTELDELGSGEELAAVETDECGAGRSGAEAVECEAEVDVEQAGGRVDSAEEVPAPERAAEIANGSAAESGSVSGKAATEKSDGPKKTKKAKKDAKSGKPKDSEKSDKTGKGAKKSDKPKKGKGKKGEKDEPEKIEKGGRTDGERGSAAEQAAREIAAQVAPHADHAAGAHDPARSPAAEVSPAGPRPPA